MRRLVSLAFTMLLTACPPNGDTGSVDLDGDGYGADEDCDDSDASVNPGASEICNGVDDDCDGLVDDEDVDVDRSAGTASWADSDGDGYGDADSETVLCDPAPDRVFDATDCDDTDSAVNPGATEICNELDDDCDGLVDDDDDSVDLTTGTSSWIDLDGDGYGDPGTEQVACMVPSGSVLDATDCDDADSEVNPGATEVCNELDDDCDELVDDDDDSVDLSTGTSSWSDLDGDGYGDPETQAESCVVPSGSVLDATDCDDADVDVHPDAVEICNELDDDCDGLVDDDDADVDLSTGTTGWSDADGDGYGDATSALTVCLLPSGYVPDSTDCDDGDAAVHPGAAELCSGVDDDCDGLVDDDDADVDLSTGATFYDDLDGDGYGDGSTASVSCQAGANQVSDSTDCDDGDAAVNPGATEVCGGADEDCNGLVDDGDSGVDLTTASTWYEDIDGDGHGDPAVSWSGCDAPSGYVSAGDDCDPSDSTISPSEVEVCEDGIDQDCSGADQSCGGLYGALDADADAAVVLYCTESGASYKSHDVLDWDGDGQQDLVVAGAFSSEGASYAGAAWVYLGPLSAGAWAHDTTAHAMVYATDSYGFMGGLVLGVPDLDGDGADEVYIQSTSGSDRGLVPGDSFSSSAYIGDVAVNTPFCSGVRGIGDQDSDGTGEWACGTSVGGAVYLYEGFSTSSHAAIYGSSTTTYVGGVLAGGDDLDGDGIEDLWVSGQGIDYGGSNTGGAFLVTGPFSTVTLADADAAVAGSTAYQELGTSVAVADLDGDGYTDYLAGAQYDDSAYTNAGAWYGFYGPLGSSPITSDYADVTVFGNARNLQLGERRLPVGDLDGDGQDDLAFCGYTATTSSGASSGASWVFYGPLSGRLSLNDAVTDGAQISGSSRNAYFASDGRVATGLTGSGSVDLILAGHGAAWGGYSGGVVYLFSAY